jgi:hypothetical protein
MSEIERVAAALMRVVLTPTEATRLKGIIDARTITDEPMTDRPTVSQAIDAVRAAAYEVHDPGTPQHGLLIVHVIDQQGIGADWDLDRLLTTIRVAGRGRLSWNIRTDRHRLTIDRGRLGVLYVDTTNTGALTR